MIPLLLKRKTRTIYGAYQLKCKNQLKSKEDRTTKVLESLHPDLSPLYRGYCISLHRSRILDNLFVKSERQVSIEYENISGLSYGQELFFDTQDKSMEMAVKKYYYSELQKKIIDICRKG
jgi:hypothetical protein